MKLTKRKVLEERLRIDGEELEQLGNSFSSGAIFLILVIRPKWNICDDKLISI